MQGPMSPVCAYHIRPSTGMSDLLFGQQAYEVTVHTVLIARHGQMVKLCPLQRALCGAIMSSRTYHSDYQQPDAGSKLVPSLRTRARNPGVKSIQPMTATLGATPFAAPADQTPSMPWQNTATTSWWLRQCSLSSVMLALHLSCQVTLFAQP